MDLDCPHLSLAPYWADENDDRCMVLVRSFDSHALCGDGGYEELSRAQTGWDFESESHRLLWELRAFAIEIGLASPFEAQHDDRELVALLADRIEHGDLVGLRKDRASVAGETDATQEQRQLVRAIESQTRGKLNQGGRTYKLVAGADVAGTPDRNSYEVVRHDDATRVLGALAQESSGRGGLAALFEKATAALSPDWRPPFAPKGVVLLRRNVAARAASAAPEAAITPSQMRAMMDSEKPLQFFARFVDERGKPVTGFTGDFQHGDDPKCDMAFSGSDFVRMGDLKGAKQAWLTFADEANQDLVDELKKRWKEIRGEADDEWKEEEESLVEVLFKDGKLPELEFEAEKKYTFMLRPPVALARLHGMYFDTNKCFLLPTAVASLKRLVEKYELHPDSEVLIVGHTDTAGSETYNLDLSADRADAMKAYLRDDADAWLAWYDEGVRESKRWGEHEDLSMIDALVPDDEFGKGSHVAAYQEWHNGEAADARQEEEDQPRSRPDEWEELKVDGILGPKTRRQLILDYMNLDGTSLEDDVCIVTCGCGEYFPLESEEGEVEEEAEDDEEQPFDRRVEVFFFAKPFGILPPVPGVAEGESSKKAVMAKKDDELYPEWRQRVSRHYAIDTESEGFRLRLCNYDLVPYASRPFAFCLEGYPEIRGTTDEGGFVIVDSPPAGAQGYVQVWPDDEFPEDTVRWDINITPVISPATPRGASIRLANLNYYTGEPTDEMTDELREAIRSFQEDNEGFKVTGELDDKTCARLRALHEWEAEGADDVDAEERDDEATEDDEGEGGETGVDSEEPPT
jgi:outer membrane protein OmpA-like peptidoglycan-associated protein